MRLFTASRSRPRADRPTVRATPRRAAAALVALVTLSACGVVGIPTAATADGGLVPDINPQQALQDAPELKGYVIDTSALSLGVVGITAKNQQYKHTGALGYHHSWFPNKTPTQQSFLTVGNDVQHTDTTSVTQTHTVSGKVSVGVKAETKVDFFFASEKLETSISVEVGYSYSNQQTSTVTNATTVKVPSTPVVVLPGHVAEVTQYVDEGTFSADLDVTGQLAGDVVLTRCGKTVRVPIGQLAALRRDSGQGSLLPTWMTPDGDTVKVKTTARWSSQLATQQIIDVKDSVISGPQAKAAPTQKATAKPVAVPYVSPVTGASTKSPPTPTKRSATARVATTSLRDIITCDASKVVVSTPSANLSLPALPNGLTVTTAAISQQGGDIHVYVLASDKKVYHSRKSGSADFGAWKVEQGSGHTSVSALTLSGGAVYSDGVTVYASYGGAFGPLPSGVKVAEVRSTGEAGPFVRGADGILYRWVSKENAWKPLPGTSITAMAASEEDEALAYTDGSVVRYWSSTRGFFSLPALPAGVGVKKLQASAQSGDAYVYVLGNDGRVYKTGLRAGGPSFSGWVQLAGAGIVDLSAATSGGGGGEYTDGRTVYATWGGTLPALPPGVTATAVVLGAAADHRTYTSVLAADGRVYRIASDAKSWETLPLTGVHGIFLSQTDATLLSSVD